MSDGNYFWLRAYCANCEKVVQRKGNRQQNVAALVCPSCGKNCEVLSRGVIPLKGCVEATTVVLGVANNASNKH